MLDSIDKRIDDLALNVYGAGSDPQSQIIVRRKAIKALLRDFATAMIKAVPEKTINEAARTTFGRVTNRAIDATLTAQQAVIAEWGLEETQV